MGEHRIEADTEQDWAASEVNDEWGVGEVDEGRQRLVGQAPCQESREAGRQVGRKVGIIKIGFILARYILATYILVR